MKLLHPGKLLLLIALLTLTAACSPPQARLTISSTANLNPNDSDEPLPVMVNIYQLSDNKAFEEASFEDLWKKDLTTLGDSMLTKETLTLNPASQERLVFERHAQAKYIGAMAIFRKPEKQAWRSTKAVADGYFKKKLSSTLNVNLKSNSIEIVD
jgi:type VI secretion system protein VasD